MSHGWNKKKAFPTLSFPLFFSGKKSSIPFSFFFFFVLSIKKKTTKKSLIPFFIFPLKRKPPHLMCVSSLSLSRMFKDRDLIGKGEKGKFERVNKRESFASIFSINYNKLSIFCLMTKIPLTIFF
jgi:hypothetical protein